MKAKNTTNVPLTETEREPRLWWLIVARGQELELRQRTRSTTGKWRLRCPVDDSHVLTLVNGRPGLALCCQGPAGSDSPGHALVTHRKQRVDMIGNLEAWERHQDLHEIPYPCRWCGCAESMILAALGARSRDKYRQTEAQRDGSCRCGASGYRVGRLPVLCLSHLSDRVGLERGVLFGATATT